MALQQQLSEMGFKSFLDTAQYVAEKYTLDITIASPFSLGQPAAHVLKDLKEEQRETLRNQLLQKTIHSVFMKEASKTECDQKASFKWLKDGRLQAQTEALIVAAQDGVVHTWAYQHRILKTTLDQQCRTCGKSPETIEHILSTCECYIPMDTAQEQPRQSVVPVNKSHSLKIEVEPSKRAQSTGRSDVKWGDGVGTEAPSH